MEEEKSEKKPEETQTTKGKYIIRSNGSYYDGNAGYHSGFAKAKIYNENEITEDIKRDRSQEIIPLDSVEGLALIVKEFKDNQHYVDIYGPRVKEAEETVKKLYNFDQVRKYIELHNKWNNPLIGITQDTEHRILEEIAGEKASSN